MATYNVNMKQFNGTSFDDVLPLAYNSQLFDNKTYADVSANIYQLAKEYTDDFLYIGFGSYVGDGTTKRVSIAFPDECVMFGIFPAYITKSSGTTSTTLTGCTFCNMENLETGATKTLYVPYSIDTIYDSTVSLWAQLEIFKLENNVGVSWSSGTSGPSAAEMLNQSGTTYRYMYVCKNSGDYGQLFTSDGVFTVPETGNYNIEIHSVGGRAEKYNYYSNEKYFCNIASGGGSGQLFENIALTAGQTFNVVVGKYNTSNLVSSFGDYTVAAGGDASARSVSVTAGVKSGNLAHDGASQKSVSQEVNVGDIAGGGGGGKFGHLCGIGGGISVKRNTNTATYSYSTTKPTDGCVYIYKAS